VEALEYTEVRPLSKVLLLKVDDEVSIIPILIFGNAPPTDVTLKASELI
jgi:hypothetical protein